MEKILYTEIGPTGKPFLSNFSKARVVLDNVEYRSVELAYQSAKWKPEDKDNYELLMATGNKYLEERNWWGDLYWGRDKEGNGENMLGKLLMEIREASKN